MQFDQILQYVLSGLSTGAIYALIGIGFSIIIICGGLLMVMVMYMPGGLVRVIPALFRKIVKQKEEAGHA